MRTAMEPQPDFVKASPLLQGALRLAESAHHGPARRGDTDIEHPVAVAELLHAEGFDEPVVAAALLHDVVEDTDVPLEELRARFGPEVADLVAEMTEDESIGDYAARKAEHRSRVSRDRRAAAIYAADKLAKAKTIDGPDGVDSERLVHYVRTLELLCERYPELPFLGQLRAELDRLS